MFRLPKRQCEMSLINIENLTIKYHGRTVLNHVSLAIEAGEIVTIVGPNGSGKSSLFKAIIGSIPYQSGEIRKKKGLKIGYVPQKLHLDPAMPMNVERFLRLGKDQNKNNIQKALARYELTDFAKQSLSDLSGGQLQKTLLARAILDKPDILMLDEATQGLDQAGSAQFYQQIEAVRKDTGCAVLMISHELHVVMSASDRVICLNGHICCSGTPDIVASAPEYRALFGLGTGGALALYRHEHDHSHEHHAHSEHKIEAMKDENRC